MTGKCLIVEIDRNWVDILVRTLSSSPFSLETKPVSRPEDAVQELSRGGYNLAVVDLSLDPGKEFSWGAKLLADIKAMQLSAPPVIVVSGTEQVDAVVDCINDYRDIVHYFARKTPPWRHLKFVQAAMEILERSPGTVPRTTRRREADQPVFISHAGETVALIKLSKFLTALNVPYVIAEEEPKHGRSVKAHVAAQMDRCGSAIMLKSKDISRSVLVEQGQLEERFPGRVVYLVEKGTPEGPLEQEQTHQSYTGDCMDQALTHTARELVAFGYFRT